MPETDKQEVVHTYGVSLTGILGAGVYLALGLAVYMWLGTYTAFTWTDPWVYIYMLLWPFVLFFNGLFWIIVAVVVIICCVLMMRGHVKD